MLSYIQIILSNDIDLYVDTLMTDIFFDWHVDYSVKWTVLPTDIFIYIVDWHAGLAMSSVNWCQHVQSMCQEFITRHVKCRECREFILKMGTCNFFFYFSSFRGFFGNSWHSWHIDNSTFSTYQQFDILDGSTIRHSRHVDKLLYSRKLLSA